MDKMPREIYSDLIGKPYTFQGRGPDEYDCLGLIYEMYKRLGVLIPEQISIVDKRMRAVAIEDGKDMFVKIDRPEPGCIIGMRIGNYVNHVAMAIDNIRFIHARLNGSVCIEKINDLKYKTKIDGFYRFTGEINE